MKKLILLIFQVTLILLIINNMENREKIFYCFEENEYLNSDLERKECIIYKIITDSPGEVSVGNSVCTENIMEFGCEKTNKTIIYFADYPLKLFCDNCDIRGNVAGVWYIDYYSDEEEQFLTRLEYEFRFRESSFNETYMINKLLNYGGR